MATTTLPFPTTSVAAPAVPAATTSRFAFLDGLRGLAALGVCLYHIEYYAPFRASVAELTPDALHWGVRHGWSGVRYSS
jgi:peptidoglycan/LPS O-acetylase OafA/YrhL